MKEKTIEIELSKYKALVQELETLVKVGTLLLFYENSDDYETIVKEITKIVFEEE